MAENSHCARSNLANPFGAIWIKQLSVLCDDSLWTRGGFHQDHAGLHCEGIFKARGQLPSGQNPTEYGICTCRCHTQDGFERTEKDENLKRWEYWSENRALLNHSSDRWMNSKG